MNYNKKSVKDIDVKGKRVLCRCDFNVPTKEGKIIKAMSALLGEMAEVIASSPRCRPSSI